MAHCVGHQSHLCWHPIQPSSLLQLDAAETRAKEATEELTRTLKEKDQRTTECLKAREHLDKVRISNERQTRELEAAG